MNAYETPSTSPIARREPPVPATLIQVITVLVVASCVGLVVSLIAQALNASDPAAEELSGWGGVETGAALLALGAFFCAGLATMYWSAVSRDDAELRGTYPQRRSTGWAVCGWFVPFAALFIPFQVVGDIWRANEPRADRARREAKADVDPGPSVLIWWWGSWLVSTIGGFFAGRADSSVDLEGPGPIDVVWTVATCAAGVLFVHILRRITAWQQTEPDLPPSTDVAPNLAG